MVDLVRRGINARWNMAYLRSTKIISFPGNKVFKHLKKEENKKFITMLSFENEARLSIKLAV
jgi:hypothetical protein